MSMSTYKIQMSKSRKVFRISWIIQRVIFAGSTKLGKIFPFSKKR